MSDRKIFTNSVTELPSSGAIPSHGLVVQALTAPTTTSMTVEFAFRPSADNQTDLEARVARGEIVPREDLESRYAPAPEAVAAMEAWLKQQGYTGVRQSADKVSLIGVAPLDKIAGSLQVDIVSVTKDGVTYSGARNAPSLPTDVGASVNAIIGLQPWRQLRKHAMQMVALGPRRGAQVQNAAPAPAAALPSVPYHTNAILSAYNAVGQGTGAGEVIAILIDTQPNPNDLTAFWAANGIAAPPTVDYINVNNVTLPAPELEETLDVCWAGGLAPGARIRLYASATLGFGDLNAALDRIYQDLPAFPTMRQLSISIGIGEVYLAPGSDGEAATQHDRYLRLAAQGVNVFVSTGDAGSNPDSTGHSATGPLQAEYPSTDSAVIAVGGTSLQFDAAGAVNELGWTGSGGGTSVFFNRQAWQQGAGVPAGARRCVPDVAAAADPNFGAFLVFNGTPTQIGGTSWAAPMWAAFCALANQARAAAGKSRLAYLNPLLYPMIGSNAFRDITSGSNGQYSCGQGYDLVTGIGSPSVAALIARLIALP